MGKDLGAQLFGVWVRLSIVFVPFPFLHWGTSKSSNFKLQNQKFHSLLTRGEMGKIIYDKS